MTAKCYLTLDRFLLQRKKNVIKYSIRSIEKNKQTNINIRLE